MTDSVYEEHEKQASHAFEDRMSFLKEVQEEHRRPQWVLLISVMLRESDRARMSLTLADLGLFFMTYSRQSIGPSMNVRSGCRA